MKPSHQIALAFLVVCIGIVSFRVVVHDTKQEAQEATQTAAASVPFPGVGSESDWKEARAIAHESANAIRAQNYDLALTLGQQAIAKYPNDPDFQNNTGYGLLLRNKGNDAQVAEGYFRQAIAIKGDEARYWDNLGRALAAQNNLGAAREAFVKAANLNPNPQQADEIKQNIQLIDSAAAPDASGS